MNMVWILITTIILPLVTTASPFPDKYHLQHNLPILHQTPGFLEVSEPCIASCDSEDPLLATKYMEEKVDSFVRRLRSFVTLTEFDNEEFEKHMTELTEELSQINENDSVVCLEETKRQLKFANRMFRVMVNSIYVLKKYVYPENAANALVCKVIETKIIALALHSLTGDEVTPIHTRIKQVNYLFRNVGFWRLLLAELRDIPIDTSLMFEDQALQAEELIEEFAKQILNEMD